jgi:hypothetical protein
VQSATDIHDEMQITKEDLGQASAGLPRTHGREVEVLVLRAIPHRDRKEGYAATVDDISCTVTTVMARAIAQSIQINIPGTLEMSRDHIAGQTEHTFGYVPSFRWLALVSGGTQIRIFATHSGRIPSAKAEILGVGVPARGSIDGRIRLIVRAAIVRPIMGSDMSSRAGLLHVRVLGEHRRGNCGGKNHYST